MSRAQLKNLWQNRKDIWKAMDTISHADFQPYDIGWHHWAFQRNQLYKDGNLVPEDCTLEMWIKSSAPEQKYRPSKPQTPTNEEGKE